MTDRDDRLRTHVAGRPSHRDPREGLRDQDRHSGTAQEVALLRTVRQVLADPSSQPRPPPDGWARFERRLATRPLERRTPRARAILQAASVACLATAVWSFVQPGVTPWSERIYHPAYTTDRITTLQVVFVETADVAEVSALLSEVGARISSGPGAMGVYRLTFADEQTRNRAQDLLGRRPDLISRVAAD
ncbi:hypothetical protein JANAI62_05200 [Jannaschia pagri]|uniref:Uncharacterized protein n=1 Tax=Jannaschia pagri TaxID=2829797 RepID=A0ABQ4NIH7_9RHOB|nr:MULTISPECIES: hypothetical protein [unclassified Jannaschia]GIT89997.1 hypothetical protein JANAI61_04550 [Jannaschia sp. AI_61]GIT93897.1 hypothetical protein JANAI62_05200 [Jannaschia sp. AI_62]